MAMSLASALERPLRKNVGGASAETFLSFLNEESPASLEAAIAAIRPDHVEAALARAGRGTLRDFLALISPQARPYLQEMARVSEALTRKRFGRTLQFFAPLYLSNECQNICTYCGFSYTNAVPRITLVHSEVQRELIELKKRQFDRILILTGEHSRLVGMEYFREMIPLVKEHFSEVLMEVQPLKEDEYAELKTLGLDGLAVYQETYHKDLYKKHHPRGKKSNFSYRLETPERAGNAGLRKIGLGSLLGLAPWRTDSIYVAMHYLYLKKRFWQSEFSISFPRLRPAEAITFQREQAYFPNERDLAQLIFAYRLLDEDLGLSLSTRESVAFRDALMPLGITSVSAGSATNPGGYACYRKETLEQFEVEDTRSPEDVAQKARTLGLDPVFKDWMREFSH